jgi:hypothetical protein
VFDNGGCFILVGVVFFVCVQVFVCLFDRLFFFIVCENQLGPVE